MLIRPVPRRIAHPGFDDRLLFAREGTGLVGGHGTLGEGEVFGRAFLVHGKYTKTAFTQDLLRIVPVLGGTASRLSQADRCHEVSPLIGGSARRLFVAGFGRFGLPAMRPTSTLASAHWKRSPCAVRTAFFCQVFEAVSRSSQALTLPLRFWRGQ